MFARSSSSAAAAASARITAVGRHIARPASPILGSSMAASSNSAAMASTQAAANGNGAGASKASLLSLPLVPPSARLTSNLLPDVYTPRPDSILATAESLPTQVRRSRAVGSGAHFSYVSPLVLEFPYDFPDASSSSASSDDEAAEAAAASATDGGAATSDLAEGGAGLSEEDKRKKKAQRAAEKRMHVIEGFMRKYEVSPSSLGGHAQNGTAGDGLRGYSAPARDEASFPSARLLGVSPAALRDCLPQLDVGDALEKIASDSGKDYAPETYTSGPAAAPLGDSASPAARARNELSDVLAGRLVAARFPPPDQLGDDAGAAVEIYRRETAKEKAQEAAKKSASAVNGDSGAADPSAAAPKEQSEEDKLRVRLTHLSKRVKGEGKFAGYAPWANCYAGHQFGSWAGQLGDGRAITLAEVASPASSEAGAHAYGGDVLAMPARTEIQLKGGGRTPYSRFADGLATLASSLREYLCSEAMAGLRVPTSRALAVSALRDVTVVRETHTVAAVCARLAPSWLRIGSFQIHASRGEWESVRILGEYVARTVLGLDGVERAQDADPAQDEKTERKPWALRLAKEVARRNAQTIARWQVYGFMHGVMNTDNISLLGLTIDYGPYAFMDIFEENQVCNHSDSEARYTYARQPDMGAYALNHLTLSLSPLIGFEQEHGRAPFPFELLRAESAQLEKWSQAGAEATAEVSREYSATFSQAYRDGWLRRLGITKPLDGQDADKDQLVAPLLRLLEDLDFNGTLRGLCSFPSLALSGEQGDGKWREWIKADGFFELERLPEWQRMAKESSAVEWLKLYAERLQSEGRPAAEIEAAMRTQNPRFVLRNWVTDEVVKRVTHKDDTRFLAQVLEMCSDPFRAWGQDEAPDGMSIEEAKSLCGVGTALSYNNLPSCSS